MQILDLRVAAECAEGDVGGKAKRLGQIAAAGYRVKPGAVITPRGIFSLEDGSLGEVELRNSLALSLDLAKPLAVRSSVYGEDGVLSWAGQFKSKLFVAAEDVVEAVRECAAAADGASAQAYAEQNGAAVGALSLVVQEMVDASVSGVAFTADPVTGDRSIMVFESVVGVAEGLAGGEVEPHRYYVDAGFGKVILSEGAEAGRLTEEQILQLWQVCIGLRELFGEQQDVEWAFEGSSLYVNQSRNITTLGATVAAVSARPDLIRRVATKLSAEHARLEKLGCSLEGDVLSDQNIAEILTPNPTPMSFGLFNFGFGEGNGGIRVGRTAMGYSIGEELDRGLFSLIGGQPRCSIIHDAFTYRIQGVSLEEYCRIVNHYLERINSDHLLANYPEVNLYEQNPSQEFLRSVLTRERADTALDAYGNFSAGIANLEDRVANECRQEFLPSWQRRVEQFSTLGNGDSLEDLVRAYSFVCDAFRNEACPMFVKVARLGFFVYARLGNLLDETFGGRDGIGEITGGVPVESNPNLQLSAELYRYRRGEVGSDEILRRFGHLAANEMELSLPRYGERPDLVDQLAARITSDPLEDYRASAEKSIAVRERLIAAAGQRRATLEREIRVAREYLPLREVVKFQFLHAHAQVRRVALRIGELLGWPEGLIFNLYPAEVFSLAQDPTGARAIAEERDAEVARDRTIEVPTLIFADQLSSVGDSAGGDSADILHGVGVTGYIAEGTAVVIPSLSGSVDLGTLQTGSILVTVTTDPAWTPLLAAIGRTGGLVTEVGGVLAHGAIYAREVGMAAVLNVRGATRVIKNGMQVRVNGSRGTVEIIGNN